MPTATRRLHPVPFTYVTIDDGFWKPRQEINRRVTIPHIHAMLEKTGRLDAWTLRWKPGDSKTPHIFWDSDVAKWIEAASYSLATHPDRRLDSLLDKIIDRIVRAQQPDGYLNTHFIAVEPARRWTNLRDAHELYCAGHLMEAAVAHHQSTGKTTLLEAIRRYADHVDATFGPGKRPGYCGHPEIELALVKLHEATGEARYLDLARYFIDERGSRPHLFDAEAAQRGEDPRRYWAGDYRYCQAHAPIREQNEAVGHAVRAMYLFSGAADIAARTGDQALLAACRRVWDSTTLRKMYITGGIGSSHHGEVFTGDYDLPNESAYAETCAAIALVFFAHRMLQTDPDSRYADVMERALYNGVLPGVGLDGRRFFYVNPLRSAGGHHRQEWFDCACCPSNVARLLASLAQYAYSTADAAVYVHLYVAGQARAQLGGQQVRLGQQTLYPWDGEVRIGLDLAEPAKFDLFLRIPGWCHRHRVKLNGKPVEAPLAKGYARIRRRWQAGDKVTLSLSIPVERITAHPLVEQDAGKVALQRGPIVYCLEQCDHHADVRTVALPDRARLAERFDAQLLGGAVLIEGTAEVVLPDDWGEELYRPARGVDAKAARIRAIPYCLWDNRKGGPMTVWLARG